MKEYNLLVTARNEFGSDSDVLVWRVVDKVTGYSNVVGDSFTTLEDKAPELEFKESYETVKGTSGKVYLERANTGGEATEWEVEGDMPPGAKHKDGIILYHNVGEAPDEPVHAATLALGDAFVRLIREVMKNG